VTHANKDLEAMWVLLVVWDACMCGYPFNVPLLIETSDVGAHVAAWVPVV